MVDDYTGKRIDVIAWSFLNDVKEKNLLMVESPLMEDEEADIFQHTQTQKPDNKKEKAPEVGDDILVIGKFGKSR